MTEVAPKLKFEKNVVEVTDILQVCLAIRLTGRPVLRGSDSGRSAFKFLKNHSASTQSEYLLSMIPASSSYLWTISRMCRSSKFGDVYPDTIMMSPSLSTSVQQIHRLNSTCESRLTISFFDFNQINVIDKTSSYSCMKEIYGVATHNFGGPRSYLKTLSP